MGGKRGARSGGGANNAANAYVPRVQPLVPAVSPRSFLNTGTLLKKSLRSQAGATNRRAPNAVGSVIGGYAVKNALHASMNASLNASMPGRESKPDLNASMSLSTADLPGAQISQYAPKWGSQTKSGLHEGLNLHRDKGGSAPDGINIPESARVNYLDRTGAFGPVGGGTVLNGKSMAATRSVLLPKKTLGTSWKPAAEVMTQDTCAHFPRGKQPKDESSLAATKALVDSMQKESKRKKKKVTPRYRAQTQVYLSREGGWQRWDRFTEMKPAAFGPGIPEKLNWSTGPFDIVGQEELMSFRSSQQSQRSQRSQKGSPGRTGPVKPQQRPKTAEGPLSAKSTARLSQIARPTSSAGMNSSAPLDIDPRWAVRRSAADRQSSVRDESVHLGKPHVSFASMGKIKEDILLKSKKLNETFALLDSKFDGTVQREDFGETLSDMGFKLSSAQLDRVQTKHGSEIQYRDFLGIDDAMVAEQLAPEWGTRKKPLEGLINGGGFLQGMPPQLVEPEKFNATRLLLPKMLEGEAEDKQYKGVSASKQAPYLPQDAQDTGMQPQESWNSSYYLKPALVYEKGGMWQNRARDGDRERQRVVRSEQQKRTDHNQGRMKAAYAAEEAARNRMKQNTVLSKQRLLAGYEKRVKEADPWFKLLHAEPVKVET